MNFSILTLKSLVFISVAELLFSTVLLVGLCEGNISWRWSLAIIILLIRLTPQ